MLTIYQFQTAHIFSGILQKWQLIFYGTATNPIRLRTPQSSLATQQAQAQASSSSSSFNFPSNNFYSTGDIFNNPAFRNLPNIFSVAGSDPKVSSSIFEKVFFYLNTINTKKNSNFKKIIKFITSKHCNFSIFTCKCNMKNKFVANVYLFKIFCSL